MYLISVWVVVDVDEIATNPRSMKRKILRGIRSSLLEVESATKVELSQRLDISFPTVSKFLDQMEKDGEILFAGLDESSGGRRAKRYTYNPEHRLGLAIFLERTETNYAIFNCKGEVKDQGIAPSVLVDDGLRLLTKSLEELMNKFPKISSMAIGVPGSVKDGRIFYIPGYEQFQDFDLKEYYQDLLSIPVVIENDMNAAVLGYQQYRKIKEKSLVYLYSGQNGPGAGILINGNVVRGSTSFSGEVSFVPQYDHRNFQEALNRGSEPSKVRISQEHEIDAISRLIASFVAIINPHTFIFCEDEVDIGGLEKIKDRSTKYIPMEHLPELTSSNWEQDYLLGLQTLCLEIMIDDLSDIHD